MVRLKRAEPVATAPPLSATWFYKHLPDTFRVYGVGAGDERPTTKRLNIEHPTLNIE